MSKPLHIKAHSSQGRRLESSPTDAGLVSIRNNNVVDCDVMYNSVFCSITIFSLKQIYHIVGNTRTINQKALQTFQDEMKKVKNDPYKVVMRQTKLPVSLLNEVSKVFFNIILRSHSVTILQLNSLLA